MRIRASERAYALEPDGEGLRDHALQRQPDFTRQPLLDIADEPQRDVIVRGLGPARAPNAALHQIKLESDILGNFEAGEKTRHKLPPLPEAAAGRRRIVLEPEYRRERSLFQRLRFDLAQELRNFRCHPPHDLINPARIGVHAVVEIVIRYRGDAVEEERIEPQAMLAGKRRIDAVEKLLIGCAEVRRCEHAGDHHRYVSALELPDDFFQAGTRLI